MLPMHCEDCNSLPCKCPPKEAENPTQALNRLLDEFADLQERMDGVKESILENEAIIKREAANSAYPKSVAFGAVFQYCGSFYRIEKKEGSGWLGDGKLVRVNVPDLTPQETPDE